LAKAGKPSRFNNGVQHFFMSSRQITRIGQIIEIVT